MSDAVFSKKVIILFFTAFCLVTTVFLGLREYGLSSREIPNSFSPTSSGQNGANNLQFAVENFIKQRNDLSKKLNDQKKMYGQASCRMLGLRKKAGEQIDDRVSENGGWCQELSGSDSASHRFDKGFAQELSKLLKNKRVGSFGDGPGDYKKALDSYQEVTSYTAYDGAPFCEKTTDGRVQFLDLSGPQFGLPAFDWVVSVEVGEHIPQQFEDIYLDNLARHAKEGIILSWAVPGQGGLSHVNNQPLDHVIAQMKKRGFDIDKDAGQPMRAASSFFWLQDNVHVYRRIELRSFNPTDV